jgi:tetratricopeptide (TPR) repeat protein
MQEMQGKEIQKSQQAVTACQDAMLVYTQQSFPEQWALAQSILGNTYSQLNHINEAIACYRSALTIYLSTTNPLNCLRIGRNFGKVAFLAKRWHEAIEGYNLAIEAVETSRSWATSESRRQEISAEAFHIYHNMVQACINAGQLEKALETVERSRAKRLVDLMASNDLYQSDEIAPNVKELLQKFDIAIDTSIRTFGTIVETLHATSLHK